MAFPGDGPPPSSRLARSCCASADPDLLLVAEDTGELKGVPAKCGVLNVQEGSPTAWLIELLPASLQGRTAVEKDMLEIASICASVNIVEAYSDPMPKLVQLLDRAMAISGAELGVILLPGEVLDELDVVLARGQGAQELVGRGLSATGSLCGRAFDTGAMQQAELHKGLEENAYLEESGVERLLALPLRAEGRVIGVFALGRSKRRFRHAQDALS